MDAQLEARGAVVALRAILILAMFAPAVAAPQDHRKEVSDLIAAHDVLEARIHSLQQRVAASPAATATEAGPRLGGASAKTAIHGASSAESLSERIRHKDRGSNSADGYVQIRERLAALERRALAERARVTKPGFGAPARSYQRDSEPGQIGFGDGREGARPPPGERLRVRSSTAAKAVDGNEIEAARNELATLERGLAALEQEVGKQAER